MWKFTNPSLPTEAIAPSPAPLARISQDDYYSVAPLARINLNAPQQLPGIERAAIPTTAVLILPTPVDGAYVVDASAINLNGVAAVEFNGSGYTPAVDLLNPQPGEFVFDPYQESIAIYPKESDRLEEGLSVQVVGTVEGIGSDRLQPPFPEIFYKVPLTGELSWNRGLEQHPSGSLTLDASDRNIDAIREAFRNGTELSFYGIGFRVNSYSEERAPIDEYPAGEWKVSISLGGRWENYTDKPVNLREQTPQVGSAIAFGDPSCVPGESASAPTTTPKNQITFAQLAVRAGAAYDGPELKIKIAADTPKDATTTLDQELQPRLRINNAFAFYSGTQAIAARNFYNTRLWSFGEYLGAFSRTYQAIANPQQYTGQDLNLPQPDPAAPLPDTVQLPPTKTLQPEPTNLVGYAAKYPCVRLEGKFAEPKARMGEDTQSSVTVKRPASKLLTLRSGHGFPELPPKGSKRIKTTSLNHDQSGPKKISKLSTSENGSPLYEETFTYGFAYLGRDIADSNGELNGIPGAWWQLVRYEKTSYVYDEETLYLLGTDTIGWQLARFKTESAETPETVGMDADDPMLPLYQFRKVPINSKTRYVLKQYREFYKDVADRETGQPTEKKCDRAGSSTLIVKNSSDSDADPEPMFIAAEASETICYARTPNPDSEPDAPLPDYETGEESYSYKFVKILPSKNTISEFGASFSQSRAGKDLGDRYIQFTPQDFGQDPNFASVSQEFTFEEFEGRPAAATRKNKAPEDDGTTGDREDPEAGLYKYVLTTPGFDPKTNPEQGNISYEFAETLQQAQDAAKLDLKLRDCKESFQERKTVPFNPWIAEGDRYRDITSGYVCDRRILGIGCKVAFNGRLIDGSLDITAGETDLTLGIERAIENDVTVHKLPVADRATTPTFNLNVIDGSSFNLGELLPRSTPNRRNPFGEQTEDE